MTQSTPGASRTTHRHPLVTILLNWVPTLLCSVLAPLVTYSLLTSHHWSQVPALLISGLWPLAEMVVFFLIRHHVDEFTMMVLIFLALGVISYAAFNSARMILVKDSAITGLFGIVTLLSLLAPRPLMFYYGRRFGTNGSKDSVAEWNALWRYAGFRHTQRVITVVWGIAFLAEAGVRIALVYVLSTGTMVAVNGILPMILVAGMIVWTISYAKRAQARGEAARAAAPAGAPAVPA